MSDPIQPGPTVARFYVASTEEFGKPDDEGHCSGKVTLNAVSRGDQNKQWASATPSGTLTMHINNGRAFEAIRAIQRAGLDVDVVLTPVPAHTPDDGHPFRQSTMPPGSSYGGEGVCGDCGVNRVDTYCERHGAEARIVPATLFRELARSRADSAFTERLRIRVKDDRELLRRLAR